MNIKQIISLIIVIVAIGAAGFFAYSTITGNSNPIETTTTTTTAEILPKGKTLNFEKINKFNEDRRLFSYPKATPPEIGQGLNDIMLKVIPTAQP